MSRADIFLSTEYSPPLLRMFPWVQIVKWWIDSSRVGGEQQAAISKWSRGVFTELPSLHLASPQLRLGRQLQLSAYWVWQRKYWLSAAIVSPRTIMETLTGIHASRHSLISLLLTLYFILRLALSCSLPSQHPASVWETDHWDAQCSREPAVGLHCALIVPKPSKCQHMRMLV